MNRNELSDSQRRWLTSELTLWQTEGLVSTEQVSRILERYESIDEASKRKTSLAVQALFGIAAFLFGLAVLLLIGFNWQEVPRIGKVGICLSVVIGFHWLGQVMRTSNKHPAAAQAVTWLACFLYGAGIWLIAQAYHLDAHYPDGVYWWAVGVLPFALVLPYASLHVLYVALLAMWSGMEVLGFAHLSPFAWLFGWGIVPNGAFLLPVLAAPGFLWCYWRRSPATLGIYVPLLAWWVILQAFAWHMGAESVLWIGAIGSILILIAESHPAHDVGAIAYRFWGVALSSVVLLILGSHYYWEGAFRMSDESIRMRMMIQVAAMLALYIATALTLAFFKGRENLRAAYDIHSSDNFRRRWFALILSGSLIGMSLWSVGFLNVPVLGLGPALLANGLTIALATYLIRVGIQEERTRPFSVGVFTLIVWAFVRYIDLIGEAGGMLGAACMFAVCGVGLIIIAKFWGRVRRPATAISVTPTEMTTSVPDSVRWAAEQLDLRRRWITIVTAAAQVLILVSMIVIESLPLLFGETLIVRVQPIDPRDFFRGDYVILNYGFNNLPVDNQVVQNLGWNRNQSTSSMLDLPVYVTLEKEPDGIHWQGVRASLVKPASGTKYLTGKVTADYRQPLQFGIEAYFVQEGAGRELENLRNSRKLSAEISLLSNGKAKIQKVIEEQ